MMRDEDTMQDTCEELTGGWVEIMMDARGSHVLRAIVRALSGLEPKQPQGGAGGVRPVTMTMPCTIMSEEMPASILY
jgi:hypothetical protein